MKKFLVLVLTLLMLVTLFCAGGFNVMAEESPISNFDAMSDTCVNWYGRIEPTKTKGEIKYKNIVNTASGFEVRFKGDSFKVMIGAKSDAGFGTNAYLKVYIDGDNGVMFPLDKNDSSFCEYTLASGLDKNKIHTIKVLKATEEDYCSAVSVSDFIADEFYLPPKKPTYKIDVYGDSITSGYGILGQPSTSQTGDWLQYFDGTSTYAAMVAKELNAQYNVMCMQGISLCKDFHRKNAQLTLANRYSNYSINNTLSYDMKNNQPDLIIINGGTNDWGAIDGAEDPSEAMKEFIDGYKKMIKNLRKKCPDARIICVAGMMNTQMNDDIEQMVKDINTTGIVMKYGEDSTLDGNVFACIVKNTDYAAFGHPGLQANKTTADKILEIVEMDEVDTTKKDDTDDKEKKGGLLNCSLSMTTVSITSIMAFAVLTLVATGKIIKGKKDNK